MRAMTRGAILIVGAGVVAAAVAASSLAASTLANGGFDRDTGGWTAAGGATLQWAPFDADGRPDSGSALITATGLSALRSGSGAYQCVPVEPNARYLLVSDVAAPLGQQRKVFPGYRVGYHQGAGCPGMPAGITVWNYPEYEMGRSVVVWLTFRPPPGTTHAWIGLMSWADAATAQLNGTTAAIYWDNATLTRLIPVVVPGVAAD